MGTIIAVTAAAGMGGTGLGGLAAYLFRRGTDRTVSVLLSFAAGMMLAVVCADLLTDAIQAGPGLSALPAASASVLAGCGGIWLLEELVSGLQAGAKRGGLFLAGVVMAAAIALHNLPEGMVIGASYAADLADEPTGALDSHTSREVLGMLQDLHKQGNRCVSDRERLPHGESPRRGGDGRR